MKYYPVRFQPIPTPRIWGGHQMKSWFGMQHIEEPIGEYWLISGHPSATSVVANGPLEGMSLAELTDKYPEAFLGNALQSRFPLLVKVIEASADLSVQVHPDDTYAREHEGDFGKTEAWYVLEAPADGKVVYGHSFPDKAAYFDAVERGEVPKYIKHEEIRPGHMVYVPARTLHALLAGTAVIEVQQTSDVTYRVYDWDRVDDTGNPRQLHVEQAANVIDYDGGFTPRHAPAPLRSVSGVVHERLIQSPYFTVDRISMEPGSRFSLAPADGPDIMIGVNGSGFVLWDEGTERVRRGDSLLIPATLTEYELSAETDLTLLRVYY